MSKDNNDHGSYTYKSLSIDDLKDCLVRYVKEIKGLEAEKKDVVDSVNASIKDLKAKIDDVVYWLDVKKTEQERLKLEENAERALGNK